MLTCFIGSWLAQSVTNWRTFNHEQVDHDAADDWLARLLG
jgi:hypothetical protein